MDYLSNNSKLKVTAKSGLRSECLSFYEVLGQSIANIGPTVSPALAIPLVFAFSGNATWLTYIFATTGVFLVGLHINQFAKRSASPGNLYTYVGNALGEGAGFLSGWALIIAYMLTASAVMCGFSNYLNVVADVVGLKIPSTIALVIAIASAWFIVSRDVKISAKLMLVLEFISLAFIFTLGGMVLAQNGFSLDINQFKLQGTSFNDLRLGLVLAFFSFVGFESATSLGDEAKNPLKNIPKAVIISGLFVGVAFVVLSYIEVMGFVGSTTKLNESSAPLSYLANKSGFGFMGFAISIGAVISFWSCAVACITASARIVLTMAQNGILHGSLGKTHEKYNTPYKSINVISIGAFVVPLVLVLFKFNDMDIFSWAGTIATLGFLFSYVMIVVSAPVYLKKIKELKAINIVVSVVSFGILMIPIVGSIYPLPEFPNNLFPFIFLAWMVMGMLWYAFRSKEIKLNKKFTENGEIEETAINL
ncbi:APC family permease [Clostridium sp. BJN0013]|uniref:APC family permease n=1 Tax=Clostridium sp. BJN0013 TaxID=3236840 RepID=UPI0034C66CEA